MKDKMVLIADDSPEDQLILRMAFEKAKVNADIQCVRDGEETVQYLSGKRNFRDRKAHPLPVLLLLDLRMPRMDGFDVLAWLQEQTGLKRLPVSVLSSSDEPTDVNRAYDLGANSYLVKPKGVDGYHELVEKIRGYWLEVNCCPDCRQE
ncbi:MAG TPA: response regulator [Verrucomicrobiae bacterium]|nr:response regulator [Verrucomicrobiae bacterium]